MPSSVYDQLARPSAARVGRVVLRPVPQYTAPCIQPFHSTIVTQTPCFGVSYPQSCSGHNGCCNRYRLIVNFPSLKSESEQVSVNPQPTHLAHVVDDPVRENKQHVVLLVHLVRRPVSSGHGRLQDLREERRPGQLHVAQRRRVGVQDARDPLRFVRS